MRRVILFVFAFLIFHLIACGEGEVKVHDPLVWNVKKLDSLSSVYKKTREYRELISYCDSIYLVKPVAITDKDNTYAPNSHYYCSLGTYWWPDSTKPGQYVNRDGYRNPRTQEYDNVRLGEMISRCKKLSIALYLSGNNAYYDAFVKQLYVWFINEDTYMLPNFEYAQVVPGRNQNKGRSSGFIGMYGFNTLLESIRLVNKKKVVEDELIDGLQHWFLSFARWADHHKYSKRLLKSNNNIGTAFDITLVNMYLFAGDERRAKEIADSFEDVRINMQIDEKGMQKAELRRTKAFSYSVYNLSHIMDFCYLVRYWYPNYYEEHGSRIDKAFEFLLQYTDNHESFPFQQVVSWKGPTRSLEKLLRRRDRLNGFNNVPEKTYRKITIDEILLY